MDTEHIAAVRERAEQLYSHEQVEAAVTGLARAIAADSPGQNLLVLSVLKGGIVATGLLMPQLTNPVRLDYIHVTRYHGTRGGELQWHAPPCHELAGEHVLLVDDIFDEGYTLQAITEHCRQAGAATVRSAVLVDKQHNRKVSGFRPDYTGLTVPDRYIVGFGMDYNGYLRNMPGIFALHDADT